MKIIIDQQITKKELKCGFALLKGKTAKETALEFNRSQRTVEHHLANLKIKLGCKRKSEVIEKLWKIFEVKISLISGNG